MSLDSNTLYALTLELSEKLKGGRIDKIYQMSKTEILLTIRSLGENYKLLLSCDAQKGRVCITNQTFQNPDTPPVFCMFLRKHLGGGKILSISSVKNERIIKIEIENTNELFELSTKILIVEIMGKHSNIILTDHNNRISDSIKHIDFTISEKRQVLPGLFYEEPPVQDKKSLDLLSSSEILDILNSSDKDLTGAIMDNFLGVSPILAREIEFLAGGDKINASVVLSKFVKQINNADFQPVMLLLPDTAEPKDLYIFDIKQYGDFYKKVEYISVNSCVDDFYKTKEIKRKLDEKKETLSKVIGSHVSRIAKKIDIHNKNIKKSEKKDRYRVYAELITANLYKLTENSKSALLENYYDENRELLVPMDETISPSRNAKRYFEKYNKEKTMEKMSAKLILELTDELSYLHSVKDMLDLSEDEKTIAEIKLELTEAGYIAPNKSDKKSKKPTPASAPAEFISSDGFTVLAGRNNRQNDELTLKIARKTDLWLHVRNIPGCHTVIKAEGREIPDTTLIEAAIIAAHYSKNSKNTKADIDYTEVRYVKKPSGAKPGMVIYDNFKTITVEPDKDIVEKLKSR